MIKTRLNAFLADPRGSVIIYVALTMPVLVGGMGLGAEAGYRYYNQRLLQHAADFSAHAGAVRKYKGESKQKIDAAAFDVAEGSGYGDHAPILANITVNIPPASGAFTGEPSAVEVILAETRPRLFSAIFSEEPVVIGARAVAAVTAQGAPACLLSLSATASPGVTVQGSTAVTLSGCSVAANSNADNAFSIPNNLNTPMSVECVYTVGGTYTHSDAALNTECPSAMENAPITQDPYSWIAEPAAASIPCQTTYNHGMVGIPSKTTNVTPSRTWTHPSGETMPVMHFCQGLDAKGVVNFAPGLYIVTGGKMTSSGTDTPQINGTGVTFYFGILPGGTGGSLGIGGNTTLALSAPKDGPYAGILFYGSDSNSAAHSIQGTAASVMEGAIYMPASKVTFSGNSAASNGCTQLIADTIVLTGNSTLTADCSDDGVQDILAGFLVSVVE